MKLLIRGLVSLLLVKLAYSMNYFQKETRRVRRVSHVHFETPVTTKRELSAVRDDDIDERSELIQSQHSTRNLSIWSSFMNMLHPHHNSRQKDRGGNNESTGMSPSQTHGEPAQSPTPSMQSPTPSLTTSPTPSDDNVSNDMQCWWCARSETSRSYTSGYVTFGVIAIGSTALALTIVMKGRRNAVTTREHLLEGSTQKRWTLFAKVFSPRENAGGQAPNV